MFPYIVLFQSTIPTYGVFLVLGLLSSGLLAWLRASKMGLDTDHLLIIAAVAFGCALAGAKLLYVFLTYPILEVLERLRTLDFSLLQEGGLVFYGGLIGGILGSVWGARIAGCRLLPYERAVVPCIPLGHAIGRLGCLAAGCCYGCYYHGPMAIAYPAEAGIQGSRFPVQPLEALADAALFLGLLRFSRKERPPLSILTLYLAAYALTRFFLEFFRGDRIRGVFWQLSTSQWISCGILLCCLALGVRRKKMGK